MLLNKLSEKVLTFLLPECKTWDLEIRDVNERRLKWNYTQKATKHRAS